MKKRMLQRVIATGMVAAMTVSMTACGGSSDSGNAGSGSNAAVGGGSTESVSGAEGGNEIQSDRTVNLSAIQNLVPEVSTQYANSAKVKHPSITLCANGDPGNLQPIETQTSGKEILDTFFERLYVIDGFGGELLPAIAESGVVDTGEQDADGNYIYTIKIRENVYDSDGNHLTASDVAYSYDYLMEKSVPHNMEKFVSVEAQDEYTVAFHCKKLDGVSDEGNLFAQQWIFTEAAEKAHDFANDPVGTGPYVVTNYTAGSSVTLEAREDYWAEGQDYQLARYCANVQTITYVIMGEASQQANALRTGEVAYSNSISETDLADFLDMGDGAVGQYSDAYVVYPYKDNLTFYLAPNCDSASQCSDINLRKAIMYAIDGATIALASGNSTSEVVYDVFNSKFPEYRDSWKTEDNFYNNPSLETAAEYLAQSSYDGSELVLLTMSAPPSCQNVATVIATVLQGIGINVKLQIEEGSTMNSVQENPSNWDLCIAMMAADDYGVVDISRLYSEGSYGADRGSINFIHDEKLQELIATANSVAGHTDENTQELHDYLIENAYGRGLFCTTTFNVLTSDVEQISMSFKFLIMPGGCIYSDNEW